MAEKIAVEKAPPPIKRPNPLKKRITDLEQDLADLQLLYENTLEHGTMLENELEAQNRRMEALQNKMRKYLSPQLFAALVGGKADADTRFHQRMRLTIYFSDIVGFSPLTDSVEPELLSDVLNTYLTRMSEIAIQYGGTVDKFVGDAVMVFFGAPEFIDDVTHAQMCVRMALDMRAALFTLREQWKEKGISQPLQVRAGINTGICTVGNFGSENRMDYTIIGGQVNITSRLQSAAQPDAIYLSSTTYSLVESIAEARYIGPVQVKGIHTPVEVWELIGLREDSAQAAPYLAVDEHHLQLRALDLDLERLSEHERVAIQKALTQALVQLSKTPKPG